MDLNAPRDEAVPRELPVLDLSGLVRLHAAGFGRVRACGEWSEPRFRQVAGPLLLAFARHVHLLPSDAGASPGSLLDAGLDACAQAVMAVALRAGTPACVDRQEAVVLRELSLWTARAIGQWQASTLAGRPLCLHARPLADQLSDAPAAGALAGARPCYRISPLPAPGLTEAGRLAAMVLLLRAAPPSVLDAPQVGTCGLVEAALALPGVSLPPCAAAGRLGAAMEALIVEGRWQLNQRKGRLWHIDGRLYLAWKTAVRELADRLALEPWAVLESLVHHQFVRMPPAARHDVRTDPAEALLSIRTSHADALTVVELREPGRWLRTLPPVGTGPSVPSALSEVQTPSRPDRRGPQGA